MERHDFTNDGNLVARLCHTPTFVMFQANGCIHCNTAKPAFQQLAATGIVRCMTVQADGDLPSEREIVKIIDKIYPGFRGYPSYMLFVNGRKIPYTGSRDVSSMYSFVLNYI